MALLTELPTFPEQLKRFPLSRYDCLPSRQDVLWSIEWGIVRTITWSEEGSMIILGYWGNGDVVGQPLSGIYPYQIECLTGVEATSIPAHEWCNILDKIMAHSRQTEELFRIVRSERVYNRLHKLLVWLGNKFGCEVPQGILIDLRLTHQNIAELIGTTRVTVTKVLKELEVEGKIIRQQRHYIILCRQLPKVKETEWME